MAMVAPWEQQTGGSVQFTGTRHRFAVDLRVGGNAPDIALPAETGLFQQFASGRLARPTVRLEEA
jgi:hypothetical protein